ncbi:MAG: glycosyltransferase [Desulfarculus sp.]|nr:glycosyltransferase [Desulfarculus sp.]
MGKKMIKAKKLSAGTSQVDLPEAVAVQPPAGKKRPTISLCMMVKNEEKRLPTALKSAAPWVDEIIVVDTGSTDNTVQIAQSYGAKVYHHPWEHSFSKHRNQSIGYATGDWLLILDADEELDPATAHWLHKLVHDPEVDVFFFELNNQLKDGGESFILHPRLFRNLKGFHYEGQVHNRPVFHGQAAKAPVRLIHYGYAEDPETTERKHQRRLEMISKWVEDEPDNYIARAYLSHTLMERTDTLKEAVEEGYTALRLAREQGSPPENMPRIYYPLLTALACLQREDEVLTHAQDCLATVPNYPDAPFYVAWAHYVRCHWSEVCLASQRFLDLQERSRSNPEEFIFFENLTFNRINAALARWVIAASQLGQEEEALRLLERMLPEAEAEKYTRNAVNALLGSRFMDLAGRMAQRLAELRPDWEWPALTAKAARAHQGRQQLEQLKAQGLKALEDQDYAAAEQLLAQAVEIDELNPEALLGLGRALHQQGRAREALPWLTRGVNAHPGFAWAWQLLAEERFAGLDHAGALVYYQRYLALAPGDHKAAARLEVCHKRLAQSPPPPTVAERPPKLLVVLTAGLSPEMVRMPTPHFLMHRAWGELMYGLEEAGQDHPAWASLYTGRGPEVHGMLKEATRQHPHGLGDLAVPSVWEVMARDYRVGLLAAPLGHPAPQGMAWSVAGRPAGLLTPDLVNPPELLPRLLTLGFRADQVLSYTEEQTFLQRLQQDARQEAFLFQTERNKLAAALALPAVDVLVVGLTALDYFQQAYGIAHYHTFAAYQQVYALIEMLVHALRPENFAVLSQRGYAPQESQPRGVGFYCLSWLKGENGRAPVAEIAPQLLKLMGLDPALLGTPRG